MLLTETDRQNIVQELLARSPYIKQVYASLYTLGGAERASIGVTIGFDDRSTWTSGIFDNSKHVKVMLNSDGTMEWLTGWKVAKKLRKCRFASVEDAIGRLVKFVAEVA